MQHDETEEPNIYPAKTRALRVINCAVRTSPLPSISPESAELKHRYSAGTQREGPIATAQAEGQADLKPKRDTRLVCHSTPPLAHDNQFPKVSTWAPESQAKGQGSGLEGRTPGLYHTGPHKARRRSRLREGKEKIREKKKEPSQKVWKDQQPPLLPGPPQSQETTCLCCFCSKLMFSFITKPQLVSLTDIK